MRKINDLIVHCAATYDTMDIGVKDMLEIFVEGDEIILKKYHPSCIFCSDARDVVPYKGKLVCKSCLAELRNAQD